MPLVQPTLEAGERHSIGFILEGALMRRILACSLFLLVILASPSHASILWGDSDIGFTYSTALLACQAEGKVIMTGSMTYDSAVATVSNQTFASCKITGHYADNSAANLNTSVAGEGSCDTGTTFNATTGACDAPTQVDGSLCADQSGARTSADPMIYSAVSSACVLMTDADNAALCHYTATANTTVTGYTVNGTVTNGVGTAPPTFATDGFVCEIKTVSQTSCKVNITGVAVCQVTGTFTGNVATPSGASTNVADAKDVCATGQTCVDVAAVTTHSDTGCASAGNCVEDDSTDISGNQQCGSVDGVMKCYDVKPTSADTKTAQTTTSTTNADGSVTSALTTDTTKTTCTDVAECTSKSSSVVTNTTTTASGATSATSTCTGTCTGTGSGLGTGTDGDGTDDSNGTATSSNVCTTAPYCGGDAYSCAILNQEWLDSCAERATPTADQQATWDSKVAASQALQIKAQTDLDAQVTGFTSTFESAATGSGGGKCFQDQNIDVAGEALVLPFSEVCDALQYFRFALLLAAYLISARLVSTEI